jgi:predicted ester cyclase
MSTGEVIDRFYQRLINARDQDAMREIIDENVVMYDPTLPGGVLHGRDAFAGFVQVLLTAFPDMRMSVEDQVIAGDTAAVRWRLHATHTGPLMDIPPSGGEVDLHGMDMFTITNNMIVQMWVALDTLTLRRQTNALPGVSTH